MKTFFNECKFIPKLELEMALMNQQPTDRHRTRHLSSRSPRKRTLSGRSQSDLSDMEVDGLGDKAYHHDKFHHETKNIGESCLSEYFRQFIKWCHSCSGCDFKWM